jgi:DNA-binding NtrC family response regulator
MRSFDSHDDRTIIGDGRVVERGFPNGLRESGEGTRAPPDDLMQAFVTAIHNDPDLAGRLRRALDRIGDGAAEDAHAPEEAPESADEFYMVGASAPMRAVFENIRRYAASDVPVLVTGESGTGKELAARAIHERSTRKAGPFIAINCAALPPTLVASELFGHEKGAFTGALARKIGRLEMAQGGTVFLDEIGDLPLDLQGHLLRFLQEKVIERVGGRQSTPVDARVVAATNVDLQRAIPAGRFREDLFYRLHVLTLTMPALRERGDDLMLLARYLLRKFRREMGAPVEDFEASAVAAIAAHAWPGNVRELIACVRRGVVLAEGRLVTANDLRIQSQLAPMQADGARFAPIDAGRLRDALTRNRFNVSRAARELKISRVTFYRLMRRFGVVIGR